MLGAEALESVQYFCYLGAKINSNADPMGEINARMAKAQTGQLHTINVK